MDMVVVLYNIRSVHNVGSVFRTCDAAGGQKIFLVGITSTPLDRFGKYRVDFAKVALGAERVVQWEKRQVTSSLFKELKSQGYEILAVEQDERSVPYYSYKFKRDIIQGVRDKLDRDKGQEVGDKLSRDKRHVEKKVALIFGEETKGLPKSVLDKCDKILEIPMEGSKESLNVSVAAGIVIYGLIYKNEALK